MMSDPSDRPLLIGWKEYIDFPEWQVKRVKVKIDTGARTSAIGAVSYQLIEVEGQVVVEMRLALHRKQPERLTTVRAPLLDMIVVRNSTGSVERRPLIEATMRLGPVTRRIRLTVTNRAGMLFRMILGRKALTGEFIVDVSKKYLLRHRST